MTEQTIYETISESIGYAESVQFKVFDKLCELLSNDENEQAAGQVVALQRATIAVYRELATFGALAAKSDEPDRTILGEYFEAMVEQYTEILEGKPWPTVYFEMAGFGRH